MKLTKIVLFSILISSLAILVPTVIVLAIQPPPSVQDIDFGCTPEFWKNNLELWKVIDVDYNADFDETFGTDYFEPNITLKQAINAEGPGWYHLASYGTAAYLDSRVNPYADEEVLKEFVHDNHVMGLDMFVSLCVENNE